ncbi:hypothetical protein ACKKBG_A11965 [Auxenochlorella protothecoides x Auxenochlorella symbiontica]
MAWDALAIGARTPSIPASPTHEFTVPGSTNQVYAVYGTRDGGLALCCAQDPESARPSGDSVPLHTLLVTPVAASPSDPVVLVRWGGGPTALVAAATASELVVVSLAGTLGIGPWESHAGTRTGKVVARRPLPSPLSGCSWTARVDGLFVCLADGTLSMLRLDWPARRLTEHWTIRPPEAQGTLAAGRSPAAPAASAAAPACRDPAVSVWWPPAESGAQGSGARREKLRHPCPVLGLAWSRRVLRKPAATGLAGGGPGALKDHPALLTVGADGDVRLWVEMALVQPAADPTQQPQLDSFFCMAMVIQGPAQGFYPGSLRAVWAEEEREEEEGDKGSGPGATHDAGDLTPRRAPPDDDLLWLVSRCRAAEGPPGMEPAGTAPHISTLTRVHVVRALQAVVVSSWRAEEGPSSAGPGAVTSAQAVLWGQLEQRRPRGAHHMDSPPSLTCRLEAREGSSTILVLESAAAAPPAVPRPEVRIDCSRFATVPAAVQEPGTFFRPRPTPRTAGLPPALTLLSAWRGAATGHATPVIDIAGSPYGGQLGSLDSGGSLLLWEAGRRGAGAARRLFPAPGSASLVPPGVTVLAMSLVSLGHHGRRNGEGVGRAAGAAPGADAGARSYRGPASDGDTRSRPLRRRWRTQDAALALATTGDLVVVGGTGDALVEALPPGTRAVALHAIAVAGGDRGAALLLLETAAQDRAGPRLAWTLRWGKERSLTGCAEGAWGGAEHVRVLGAGLDLLLSAERGALRAWRAVERDGESGAELVPAGLYALPDEATVLAAAAGACGLVAALTGGPVLADSAPLAEASAGKKAADPPTLLLHVWRGRHAAVQTLPPLARDGVATSASLAWVPHAVAPALAVVLGADALLYCQQPGGRWAPSARLDLGQQGGALACLTPAGPGALAAAVGSSVVLLDAAGPDLGFHGLARTIAARHGPLPAHGTTTLAALLACGARGVAVHLLIARAAALEGGAPGGEAEAALQRALAALWAAWSVALRLPALLAGLRESTAPRAHGWERERNGMPSTVEPTGMLDLAAFGMGGFDTAPANAPGMPSTVEPTGMLDLAAFGMGDMGTLHAEASHQGGPLAIEPHTVPALEPVEEEGQLRCSRAQGGTSTASTRSEADPDLPDPERVTAAICRLGSNGGGALARVLAASDSAGHARLNPAGRAFLDLARAAGHHGMPQGGLAASLQLHSGLGLEAVVWALMSGTQEVLLEEALPSLAAAVDSSTAASESGPSAAPSFLGTRADAGHAQPPTWEALRAAGAGFWLRDPGLVLDVGEKLAKAQFAAARKPDACALLYVALGKKATLQGLYRTTNARKQADFLGRDFGLPANAQSAAKNAFVLLGQHRFSLAAAFFLLGGHVSDALDVCVRELSDLQLALFIRRIVVLVMGGKGGGVVKGRSLGAGSDGAAPAGRPPPGPSRLLDRHMSLHQPEHHSQDHASGPNAPAAPHHLEDWGWGAAARAALLGDDAGLLCALCWRVRWERGGALAAAQLPALAAALLPHIVGVEAAVYDVKRERDGDAIDDADHATLLAQQLRGALTAAATSLDAARLPLLALGSAAAAIAIGPAAKEGEETGLSKTLDPLTPFLARLAASALVGLTRSDEAVVPSSNDTSAAFAECALAAAAEARWPLDAGAVAAAAAGMCAALDAEEMAFAPEALPERLGSERDSSCSTLGLGALSRVSSSSRGGGEGTAAAAWELKRQPIVCVDGDRCGALALCSLTSPDELGGRALVVSTHRHGLVASDVIPLESAAHRGAAEAGSRPETPVSTPDVGGFQAPAAQGGIFSRIISHIFDQASWEESEKWGSSTMAESDLGFGGFVGGPTSPHTPPARGHIDGLPELGSMHASALCAHPTRQFFLSADGHGFVHLWQFGEREALASFTPLPPPDLASWGSGSLLSMGSRLFSGSLTSQLGGWGCCQDLAWSPAADAFAAVGEGGVVATWRLGRPKGVDADGHACAEWWHQCLARKGRAVTYIDEAVLAVGGEDASGNLVLWDSRACSAVARLHPTTPGDGVTRLLGPSAGLWSLAAGTVGGAVVALDLRRLSGAAAQPAAVGAGAPPALLWQAAHKKAGAVTALTRLAGGWVAAGYADGDLRMFDPGLPSAPLVLREERAHGARSRRRAAVSGLAGCPEGLVSAGADGAVFLWTLERSPEGQSSDYN